MNGSHMKAGLLRAVEHLEMTELPVPAPSAGELLVRVRACAVCGTDVKVYRHGHRHIVFPRVTGHEVSGEIAAVGTRVAGWRVGDRVAVAPAVPCGECLYCHRGWQTMCDNLTAIGYHYDGGFAEYLLVPEHAVRNGCVNRIPDGVSFEEATLAEPLACVINGQEISGVGLGDAVAILGAGPIGCLHAELAAAAGASPVILADIDAGRLALAEFTGASLVDMRTHDVSAAVADATSGRMADRVIVATGAADAQRTGLSLAAKRGSVNFFGGLPSGAAVDGFDSNRIHYAELTVVGTHGSAPRHNQAALHLIAQGKISAGRYLTGRFPLDDLPGALAAAEQRQGLKSLVIP